MIRRFLLIVSLFFILPVMAQEEPGEIEESVPLVCYGAPSRPVTSVYSLEFGRGKAYSTYLSPLQYSGSDYRISGQWSKALPANPANLTMCFDASVDWKNMLNPRHTAQMVGFEVAFDWHFFYRRELIQNLQIAVGGGLAFDAGMLYLTRNGNNPVSALVAVSIDAAASASWHFNLGRLPVLLADDVRLPSLGAFFSPQYGETYYEIYLGNHRDLVHCGWWGNRFGVDNLFSVNLDFGRTALRIGYRYKIQNQWASHINDCVQSHSLVIGVIPGGLGLKRNRGVSALFPW